ncbi:MAG TPA: HutP family protein [Deltaproteobacteria bacterium]|nr:HutP family protein [Deltaproteobacteria bacterium]HQB40010.1 HutP family protein [Deltaproteobacteria bacterium]
MDINVKIKRIGKIALIAAASDAAEEEAIKALVNGADNDQKIAVTFVSGLTGDIKKNFIKSLIGCAIQNELIEKKDTQIHSIVHAGLDALRGIITDLGTDISLKMKVAIVRDKSWVAVALYGDSAYSAYTNHERAALGLMHIG